MYIFQVFIMTAMFTLPDGQTYKAKKTRAGLCQFGVAVEMHYPNPDGTVSPLWVLYSQHTNFVKARDAAIKAINSAPHLNACKLVTAA